MTVQVYADIWETISSEAEQESPLWGAALKPVEARETVPVFSPLGVERFGLGLETIYEGYLLHYGRPRLFEPADEDASILIGDYLYAHGLVRIARHGDVSAVADLAELISLCSQLRMERSSEDGAAWAGTVALLGASDGRLSEARAALRDTGDPAPLSRLARDVAGDVAVEGALALHRERLK